jgi:hypothetical protein
MPKRVAIGIQDIWSMDIVPFHLYICFLELVALDTYSFRLMMDYYTLLMDDVNLRD